MQLWQPGLFVCDDGVVIDRTMTLQEVQAAVMTQIFLTAVSFRAQYMPEWRGHDK